MVILQTRKRGGTLLRFLTTTLIVVVLAGAGRAVWLQTGSHAETQGAPHDWQPCLGVGALGRLEPGWKIYQIAPASTVDGAKVETLAVAEGDLVQPGTVLAVLHIHAARAAALREATAQVQVAQARLALVKAGTKPEEIAAQEALIAKQRAALEHANVLYQRAQQLNASRALSLEELEQRKMEAATQQAAVLQAEKTLAAMKAIRAEDVAVAAAELAKAEAGVARATADLHSAQIVSPIAGRVLKIHARAGERVGESGLAEIGDTSAMHAVAEVYERDAPRVKVGQRARVKIQSLPGELKGEVLHVGWKIGRRVVLDNDPIKDTDARVVEVRVKLDADASNRVAGLSYARVEVALDAPLTKGD